MDPLPTGLQALIPAPPATLTSLPPGTALTALVNQILIPGQLYRVDVKGLLLDLQLAMMLEPGDRVPMKVKESGPRGVVLSAAPPPPKPQPPPAPPAQTPEEAVRAAGLPVRDDTVRAARALRSLGAPVTPETIQTVADTIRTMPPRPQTPPMATDTAAAYVVTRGLPPTPAAVERVAPVFAPPSPPSPHAPAVPREVVEALRPPPLEAAPAPQQIEQRAAQIRALPETVQQVIADAARASPILAHLDAAIAQLHLMLADATAPAPPPGQIEQIVNDLIQRLALQPDQVVEAIRSLPASPALLTRLLRALEETELRELQRLPTLRQMASRPDLTEPAERAAAARVVNNLAALQGEGITIIEVPVKYDEAWNRAMLIFRRSGKQGASYEGFESFTVDVSMSRLGRVVAHVGLSRHTAAVTFNVRGKPEQRLFEAHQAELVAALGAHGLDASVAARVRGEPSDAPSMAEHLRALSVDIVA